ncbi:helix-turn-helix transcriptional regulator [Anaerotruncus massiliensis (ex Liu et al. 2021)]|uniref:helix-turn-helix transcriptional regulator n=1 Tax=Anaerotruncus massiliensis (ex Liu et al. 2021) TaxID=2321404 RepID=UPI003AB65D80
MGIGKRIKEARERLGLTQEELGKLVGVTGSSITNYEKETSHPKEPVMYALIKALDVDANYLFQDCVAIKKAPALPVEAIKVAQDYNTLDDHGRRAVRAILSEEIDRMQGSATPLSPDTPSVKVGNVAARGGGVHAPDEEELKDMQAVYEKLVLPAEERKKRRSRGGK